MRVSLRHDDFATVGARASARSVGRIVAVCKMFRDGARLLELEAGSRQQELEWDHPVIVFHGYTAVKRKAETRITNRENMRPPLTWVPQTHWQARPQEQRPPTPKGQDRWRAACAAVAWCRRAAHHVARPPNRSNYTDCA